MSDSEEFEPVGREELARYDNVISQRRAIQENLAGYGWGPSKIGRHLFREHRHLIPCETEDQAIDLTRKDLKVIFSDITDAEDALASGNMAVKLLRKRLMAQYELAWTNAQDLGLSEPYRASQAKLARDLTMDLAKLDKIDLDSLGKTSKEKGRFVVVYGEGGVARTVAEEEDDNSN